MLKKTGKIILLLLMFSCVNLFSQDSKVQITTQAEKERVMQGQPLTVTFTLYADKEADSIPVWNFDTPDFEAKYDTMVPNRSHSISIINGRKTEVKEVRYSYKYTLKAHRLGRYQINGPLFSVGGKTYRSQPFVLEITGIQKNPWYSLSYSRIPQNVYAGERVDLHISLAYRNQIRAPYLNIKGLEESGVVIRSQVLDNTALQVDLNGVACSAEIREGKNGNEIRIPVSLIFPEAGRYSFSEFQAGFMGVAVDSVPGFMGRYQLEDLLIPADNESFELEARPLPVQGRPQQFSGLIGQPQLVVSASPPELKAGDPLSLTVTIKGINDSMYDLPSLQVLEGFNERFKIPETRSPGRVKGYDKSFIQTLRPQNSEVAEVPPIRLNYFNTRTGRYETLRSEPISLKVSEAVFIDEDQVIYNSTAGRDLAISYRDSRQFHNLKPAHDFKSLYKRQNEGKGMLFILNLVLSLSAAALVLLAFIIRFLPVKESEANHRFTELINHCISDIRRQPENTGRFLRILSVEVRQAEPENRKKELLGKVDRLLYSPDEKSVLSSDKALELLKSFAVEDAHKRRRRVRKGAVNSAVTTIILLTIILAGCKNQPVTLYPGVTSDEYTHHLTMADKAFDEGLDLVISQSSSSVPAFEKALLHWSILVDSGIHDDRIYFNMGNCHRFLREDAQALLRYKQALLIKEESIYREAVNDLLAKNGFKTTSGRLGEMASSFKNFNNGSSELLKWTILLITVNLMLLIALSKTVGWKFYRNSVIRIISAALLITAVLISASITVQRMVPASGDEGVILNDVSPRSGDSFAYQEALSHPLYPGQLFKLLEQRNGWFYIELPGGIHCWIPEKSAQIIMDNR